MTAIYKKIFNNEETSEICYRCEKFGQLLSPCGNIECDARIHSECLEKYIEENNMICPKCSQNIISNQVNVFNTNSFLIKSFITITHILGFVSPILFMIGSSFVNFFPDNINSKYNIASAVILAFLLPAIMMFFIEILANPVSTNRQPLIEYSPDYSYFLFQNKQLYVNYVAIFLVNSFILFCQLSGFVILKIATNNNHFDMVSYVTGSICIIGLVLIYGITHTIIFCSKVIYYNNIEKKTVYGIVPSYGSL